MVTAIFARYRIETRSLRPINVSALAASHDLTLLDDCYLILVASYRSTPPKASRLTPQSPGYLQGIKDSIPVPTSPRFHSLQL